MKQTIKDGRIDQSNNAKYTFVPGTRVITISHTNFTDQDVIVIYNETQKKLITGTGSKDLLLSVENGVITYADSLPVLAIGDKLSIDIDFGPVATETLINEMNVDRSIICQAVRDKGQQVNDTDNSVLVASKIRAISSSIRVASTPGILDDWHSLNEAVASVNDIAYPYKYALLIPKGVDRVYLQGANRFDISDGFSTTNSGSYTFDKTKDELPATKSFYEGQMAWMTDVVRIEANTTGMSGNANLVVHVGETLLEAITLYNSISDNNKKISLISGNGNVSPTYGDSAVNITGGYQGNAGFLTRWIVFSSSSPNPVHSFGTVIGDPAFSWARKITWLFIYNVSIQGLNMDGCWINKISFDESYRLTNGVDDPANNTFKFIQQDNFLRNNYLQDFKFPPFLDTLSDADRLFELKYFTLIHIQQLLLPLNTKSVLFNSTQQFINNTALTSVIFPKGLTSLILSSLNIFQGCGSLSYIFISKPLTTFNGLNGNAFTTVTTQPINIELEKNWNYSIGFGVGAASPNLQAEYIKEFILARLALYDMWTAAPTNAARLSTNGTATVTGTDGMDFTKYFRAGMSIQIEMAATGTFETKVIQSLTANELILTTAASDTAVGRRCKQSGIALTFGVTNLAKISGSAELIAAQAAGYTFA